MTHKFTFKKTIREGRYRAFQRHHTTIKLQGKEVGYINESDFKVYVVRFAVKQKPTRKDPAPFHWIRFKKKFKSEGEAREHIKKFEAEIQERYDLYQFED